jgi:hypothetical protein
LKRRRGPDPCRFIACSGIFGAIVSISSLETPSRAGSLPFHRLQRLSGAIVSISSLETPSRAESTSFHRSRRKHSNAFSRSLGCTEIFGGLSGGLSGGADRDRTDDLLNAIQALSQLSYGPTREGGG